MKGHIITVTPDGAITSEEVSTASNLDKLQGIVGGSIELLPYFTWLKLPLDEPTDFVPCVAYCDEEGKLKGKPTNQVATMMWAASLIRNGVIRSVSNMPDVATGTITILWGDDEFMENQ